MSKTDLGKEKMAQTDPRVKNTSEKDSNKHSHSDNDKEIHWIDKVCSGKSTVDEKIVAIVSYIEAEPIYYKHVSDICGNLDQIMKYFYGYQVIKIEPFGSAVTNLALKGSDVDIFLDFGGKLPDINKKFLWSLKNKIQKYGFFKRPVPVPARVPILQCLHKSGITCDISFLNGLGVANSNLIKFLLSLDNRARPLMLILKVIMKKEGVIGPNALSSYALIILVIFFLQKLEKPKIPAISHLQALATTKETIANWSTSFISDPSQLPVIDNNLSVIELLKKFFEFYASFEFGFYVISSYTAKTYLKSFFTDPDLLPPEFKCYRENVEKQLCDEFELKKNMCVQGPFNHSHNITRSVTDKILQQFQNICFRSKTVYENLEKNQGQDYETEYIKYLFKDNLSEHVNKKLKGETDIIIYVGENLILSDGINDEEELRNNWFETVFNKVTNILVKVMKCKVNTLPKEEYKNNLAAFTSGEVKKLLQCELYYLDLVTKKRNEIRHGFDFPQSMCVINQEELISDYLCETVLTDDKKVSLKFEIVCYIKKGPTCFCMHLECKEETKSNKNSVKQIFQFMSNFGTKLIKSAF